MSIAAIPMPRKVILSPEQKDVLNWVEEGDGSIVIEAVAGSGKTFVLDRAAPLLTGTSAYAVFNKKNADEAKEKMGHVDGLSIGTCHSFGFAALRECVGKVQVKAWDKRKAMLEECKVPQNLHSAVARLVSLGKQTMGGYSFNLDDTAPWVHMIEHFGVMWMVDDDGRTQDVIIKDLVQYARRGIKWSREATSVIDFDDMIWLPLLDNMPIRQYDWVLLDECQDLNVSRQLLASRMLKPGGRLIAVGDRHQAIYGFSGADSDSLDNIAKEHECIHMPLSTTYRCSKAATELAQRYVPNIEAHENNGEGSVKPASLIEFREQYTSTLTPDDAILCRLTRPLVTLAFELIRDGIGCHVEGKDIGKQLERMATKWKVKSVKALTTNLEAYRTQQTELLKIRKAFAAIETLNDRIETLYIIMEGCETVTQVVNKIQSLFQDTKGRPSTVTLSTIHKAKGREWERVFVLGWSEYMPSKWARQEWEKRQENNLQYVAITRTKADLILIGEGIK